MRKTLLSGVGLLPFPLVGLFLLFPLPVNSYRPFSHAEFISLVNLEFPQSERAMRSRFGRPFSRDAHSDYYPMENQGYWVQIDYVGRRAQGYTIYFQP